MDEFEVYLVSNGSMTLFPNNTLAAFTNYLSEPFHMEGDWRVALSSITSPTCVKNVTDTEYAAFATLANLDEARETLNYDEYREMAPIKSGMYKSVEELLDTLTRPLLFGNVQAKYSIDPVDGKLTLSMPPWNGFTFLSREIPNILGFEGITDYISTDLHGPAVRTGVHIGYKGQPKDNGGYFIMTDSGWFDIVGDYPVDITSGKSVFFVYVDIIEYQHVADTKAPLLRMFNHTTRMKNNAISPNETRTSTTFKDLEYKKLLTNNITSIKVEIRTEDGHLVPFLGTGRTALTLKFKRFDVI